MTSADTNLERFTQPHIQYAEVFVPGTPVSTTNNAFTPGLGGPITYINQEVCKVKRPTLIDYIAISEETLTCNGGTAPTIPLPSCPAHYVVPPTRYMVGILPGAGGSFLNGLRVNWWVTDRPRAALRLRSPYTYNNYADRIPFDSQWVQAGWYDHRFEWKFRKPWLYTPGNSIVVEWTYVTGAWNIPAGPGTPQMPPPFPPIRFSLHGVGLRTRHRRLFEFEIPAMKPPTMVFPVPPVPQVWDLATSGSFAEHEFVSQLNDETYEINSVVFRMTQRDSSTNEALTTPPYDARMFNMIRFKIHPSQSEPFSDDPVPLILYGIDAGPPGRVAWYQPTGGPILLQPGQSIGWEIQSFLPPHTELPVPAIWPPEPGPNDPPVQTTSRFQVALFGRVAPNDTTSDRRP